MNVLLQEVDVKVDFLANEMRAVERNLVSLSTPFESALYERGEKKMQ